MNDLHLTQTLLDSLERGELARSAALGWLVDHVLALCPICRGEREAFRLEQALGPSGQMAVAGPVLSWLVQVAPVFAGRKRQADVEARRDLAKLLTLRPEDRPGHIERSRTRFRSPELVELLLAEAHQRIRPAPWESHELAQLALEVSWQGVRDAPPRRRPWPCARGPWPTPPMLSEFRASSAVPSAKWPRRERWRGPLA